MVWDVVEGRFQKQVIVWKRLHLSKGRGLISIESTFSSFPICFMSLFVISRKVSLKVWKDPKCDFLYRRDCFGEKVPFGELFYNLYVQVEAGLGMRSLFNLNKARLYSADGVRDLVLRGTPFGREWLQGSMGRKCGGGAHKGKGMKWECERLLEMGERPLIVESVLRSGMDEGWKFGRMGSVVTFL